MSAALERLVMQERERLEQEQQRKGVVPTDQHAQFRSAVRTVLTILLDESSNSNDQVKRATDILLGLPVPMPQGVSRSLSDVESASPLYVAGLDGLPTTTEYVPEQAEGPLTAEEVAIMLRAQRGE